MFRKLALLSPTGRRITPTLMDLSVNRGRDPLHLRDLNRVALNLYLMTEIEPASEKCVLTKGERIKMFNIQCVSAIG
jgi:hypothetical protein